MDILSKDLRMTKQRKVILEEIRKSESHLTADEIYKVVKEKVPNISLGTVYRNLEILSEKGLIRKIELAHTKRRYDGNMKNHYHIICTECGRVDDLITREVGNIEELLGVESNYKITGYRLKFFGICPDCREKEEKFNRK